MRIKKDFKKVQTEIRENWDFLFIYYQFYKKLCSREWGRGCIIIAPKFYPRMDSRNSNKPFHSLTSTEQIHCGQLSFITFKMLGNFTQLTNLVDSNQNQNNYLMVTLFKYLYYFYESSFLVEMNSITICYNKWQTVVNQYGCF